MVYLFLEFIRVASWDKLMVMFARARARLTFYDARNGDACLGQDNNRSNYCGEGAVGLDHETVSLNFLPLLLSVSLPLAIRLALFL